MENWITALFIICPIIIVAALVGLYFFCKVMLSPDAVEKSEEKFARDYAKREIIDKGLFRTCAEEMIYESEEIESNDTQAFFEVQYLRVRVSKERRLWQAMLYYAEGELADQVKDLNFTPVHRVLNCTYNRGRKNGEF